MWITKRTSYTAKEIFETLSEVSNSAAQSFLDSSFYDGQGASQKLEYLRPDGEGLQVTKCSGGRAYAIEIVKTKDGYEALISIEINKNQPGSDWGFKENKSIPKGWNTNNIFNLVVIGFQNKVLKTLEEAAKELPRIFKSNKIFLPEEAYQHLVLLTEEARIKK